MTAQTVIYHDPVFKLHMTGSHPECPERLVYIEEALKRARFASRLVWKTPSPADIGAIEKIHSKRHLEMLRDRIEAGATSLDIDTPVSPESWRAALKAVGAVIEATTDVLNGATSTAFCAVRPPGHHAEPDKAMGFCLINNVAVAARYAIDECGAKRVAIIDFDVHHGNGTQAAFYNDPDILFVSYHQQYIYPGSGHTSERGSGAGIGATMNFPLDSGAGDAEFMAIFDSDVTPAIEKFGPDIIFISAGFDAHIDDPLGGLALTTDGYGLLTSRIVNLAKRVCAGRVVSTLEGGYNLSALADSVVAHVEALLD